MRKQNAASQLLQMTPREELLSFARDRGLKVQEGFSPMARTASSSRRLTRASSVDLSPMASARFNTLRWTCSPSSAHPEAGFAPRNSEEDAVTRDSTEDDASPAHHPQPNSTNALRWSRPLWSEGMLGFARAVVPEVLEEDVVSRCASANNGVRRACSSRERSLSRGSSSDSRGEFTRRPSNEIWRDLARVHSQRRATACPALQPEAGTDHGPEAGSDAQGRGSQGQVSGVGEDGAARVLEHGSGAWVPEHGSGARVQEEEFALVQDGGSGVRVREVQEDGSAARVQEHGGGRVPALVARRRAQAAALPS
ncbi:hypothetical protein T484DRAFT_1913171, partial [Baffinella frigidus]